MDKLKILVPVSAGLINPYPGEIYQYLKREGKLDFEFAQDKFWCPDLYDFDVVHIQWPEALLTNFLNSDFIVNANNIRAELYCLTEVLYKWRKKARVVITRHNSNSHNSPGPFIDVLFDIVYKLADVVVHLGDFSLKEYQSKYQFPGQVNTVIPHHMYDSYPKTADRAESRKKLGIDQKAFVLLVFGSVRNTAEVNLIKEVFRGIEHKNKLLVAPRWLFEDYSVYGGIRMRVLNLKRKIALWLTPNVLLGDDRHQIVHDDVQYYFQAADMVLCPRTQSLNSGVVPLAFAFGKPVMGCAHGNIEQILRDSGNILFDKDRLAEPIAELNALIRSGGLADQGERNFKYGREHMSIEEVAERHLKLYRDLTSDSKTARS